MTYANDVLLAFYGSSASTISRHVNAYLEKLLRYFTDWKHVLNAGKYVAIVFGGRAHTVYPNFKDFAGTEVGLRVDTCFAKNELT